MGKRFIGSELWDSDWFLDLPDKYKILWVYIITKCDCAGVWEPNLKTVSRLLNNKYDEAETLQFFSGQIVKIKNKWFLPKFIRYQSGKSPSEKMIKPINNALSRIGYSIDTVAIQYRYSSDTPIEIEREIDKNIDIDVEIKKERETEIETESCREIFRFFDEIVGSGEARKGIGGKNINKILNLWGGIKKRGRCGDCKNCGAEFKKIWAACVEKK